MKAYIQSVEYYLPEKIVTNKDISIKFPEWSEEKIFEKVGIRERHIAAEDETALDRAEKVCLKLFENNPTSKENIDFIGGLVVYYH